MHSQVEWEHIQVAPAVDNLLVVGDNHLEVVDNHLEAVDNLLEVVDNLLEVGGYFPQAVGTRNLAVPWYYKSVQTAGNIPMTLLWSL